MSGRILEGPFKNILPETPLGHLFYASLKKWDQNKILFIDPSGEEVTYGTLLQTTVKLGTKLIDLGVKKGDYIAVVSQNHWKHVATVVAGLYVGVTIIVLNPDYTTGELKHFLSICKPRVVFCTAKILKNIQIVKEETCSTSIIITYDKHETSTLEEFDDILKDVQYNATFTPIDLNPREEIAFILTSSGTTGLPKGVQLTHSNFIITMSYAGHPEALDLTEKDRVINFLPFFHIFGLGLSLGSILYGAKLIILDKFLPDNFLNFVQIYKVNKLWMVPPILLFLLKHPLVQQYDISSIKTIFCGGAPVKKEIEEAAIKQLHLDNLRQLYGMTECAGAITVNCKTGNKVGSCGKLIATFRGKICDIETGIMVGPHQVGEIRVKGPATMKGYLSNEKETQEAFDEDGFLKTGDLGYYDEDGFLYISDRLKELIKYKGFQVAPAELENLLLQHAAVRDVAVCGKPDDRAGELPFAFIVKQDHCVVTEDELIDYVAENLSIQKHLYGGVKFVEEIPKNSSGKILRKKLKELLFK